MGESCNAIESKGSTEVANTKLPYLKTFDANLDFFPSHHKLLISNFFTHKS